MSRVGKAPITLPDGVDVDVDGRTVVVTGARGTLSHQLPAKITVHAADGALVVERPDNSPSNRSLHGLTRSPGSEHGHRSHRGIHQGAVDPGRRLPGRRVERHLARVDARLQPQRQDRRARRRHLRGAPQRTQIVVKGIDKQLVGQVAADIRKWRPPEPYKGKGIRYVNERVKRKAGKAAK